MFYRLFEKPPFKKVRFFMKIFYVLQIFIIVTIYSCNSYTNKKESSIKIQKTISRYDDSTFVRPSHKMLNYNKDIFISDHERILRLNKDLQLIQSYGMAGKGPGEFTDNLYFYIEKDSIYAVDEMQKRIHVFHLVEGYCRTFYIPVSPIGNFVIYESLIYIPNNSVQKPIVCLDLNGNVKALLGKWADQNEIIASDKRRNTILDLQIISNKLIAINKCTLGLQVFKIPENILIFSKNNKRN